MKGQAVYKIGTIAERAGITPNLLRAWGNRYNLFRPQRGKGGQRLYSSEDLRLLLYIKEKIETGLRIGEIAAFGRGFLLREMESGYVAPARSANEDLRQSFQPGAESLGKYIDLVAQAAVEAKAEVLRNGLHKAKLELSLDEVIFKIIIPAMLRIGAMYLDNKVTIAGEHMTSSLVEQFILNAIDEALAGSTFTGRPEICCCLAGEEHRIGLLVVAYTLARKGKNVVLLGDSMPLDALEQSIRQIQPSRVWLSVTSKVIYRENRIGIVKVAERSRSRIIVGGQGVPPADHLLVDAGCSLYPASTSLPDVISKEI